jgi:sterol desaturase/sphingolipid hydroxylase (fatty acid hydroxylase superfamily)
MDIHQRALGRGSYYADFVGAPLLAALAVAWSWRAIGPRWAFACVVGWCTWSLFEYVLHRFFLHGPYRRLHAVHHGCPAEHQSIPGAVSIGLHGSAGLLALAIGGPEWGAGGFVGLSAGFLAYLVAHDAFHRRPDSLISRALPHARRRHEAHHRGLNANFGIVFVVWDRVFGTHHPV